MARAMGIDPATKQYVKFDIGNQRFAENYFKILHHPLEQQGIDFFWLDWQQEGTTGLAGLNPTFWLNYAHSTDMERRGKRPLIYHRWGGLGNHRYQIGFSGDTISTWESLAFQPYFTATAANVGYGYWSHDIGGHMPARSTRRCIPAGCSLARSAPSCARTRRRIPKPSAASGRILRSTTT